MTILEKLETRHDETAEMGRFFDELDAGVEQESPASFFRFSRDFWGSHADILPSNHGLILQTNLENSQDPPSTQDRSAPKITSLYFDSRNHDRGVFNWHLTVAVPEHGRTEHKIAANPTVTEIRTASFDLQGRSQEIAPDTSVSRLVLHLALGEEVAQQAKAHREMRIKREQELSRFSVGAIYKYGSDLYKSKLKDLQDRTDSTGFAQSTPFRW